MLFCKKMLNLGFQNLRPIFYKEYTFFSRNNFSDTYGYLFELILALLIFGNKGVRVLGGPFLRSKILWYVQNFQWIQNSIFPSRKHIFPNSLINS